MASPEDTLWDDRQLDYAFGPRLKSAFATRPYKRKADDPLFRRVSVLTSDPSAKRSEGSIEQVSLRYEPLDPGPVGSVFEVENRDAAGIDYPVADLEDGKVLLDNGYRPSISCPEFHAQMVYAVASITYESFRQALGRPVSWAFAANSSVPHRLRIKPFGAKANNAWYDAAKGEVVFGYFDPPVATPTAPKDTGKVYTSLSHDIIVHEMSHALLDGLRSHFLEPTHKDVLALHEAFADLMAFFQQFQFRSPVRSALLKSKGGLLKAEDLVNIAQEFGQGIGNASGALRTLVDYDETEGTGHILTMSNAGKSPHARGSVLVRAIVTAFCTIFEKRARKYIRLATEGRIGASEMQLSEPLLDLLVEQVAKLARQFQGICIRAVDYCPPVDVRFGDFLRALVTADIEQVPNDDLGYRETLIRSFGEREIYGEEAAFMTEDALRWQPPRRSISLPESEFQAIGQLGLGLPEDDIGSVLRRLADATGKMVIDPDNAKEFGLVSPLAAQFDNSRYGKPVISSIAIARRVGLDQPMTNDLIAEVVQRRSETMKGKSYNFYGGATIIMDYDGRVRFAVRKRVDNAERAKQQTAYISGIGKTFWELQNAKLRPVASVTRKLCAF